MGNAVRFHETRRRGRMLRPLPVSTLVAAISASCGLFETQQSFTLLADGGAGGPGQAASDARADTLHVDATSSDATHEDVRLDVAHPDVAHLDVAHPDATRPDAASTDASHGDAVHDAGADFCSMMPAPAFCETFDEFPATKDAAVLNSKWAPGAAVSGSGTSVAISTAHAKSLPNSLHITLGDADGGAGNAMASVSEHLFPPMAGFAGISCQFDFWLDPPAPTQASAIIFHFEADGFASTIMSTYVYLENTGISANVVDQGGGSPPGTAEALEAVPTERWIHYSVALTPATIDGGDTVAASAAIGTNVETAAFVAPLASDVSGVYVSLQLSAAEPGRSTIDAYFDNFLCAFVAP